MPALRENEQAKESPRPQKGMPAQRKAARLLKPVEKEPSAPDSDHGGEETQILTVASGDALSSRDAHRGPGIAAIVKDIVQAQKIRRFCIVSQSRCDRSIESLIASTLGYRPDQDEGSRKAVFKQASEIRRVVEKNGVEGYSAGEDQTGSALISILHLIPLSASARALWDVRRKEVEKDMVRLAGQLPVAAWAEAIRGFSLLNLAIILGEAGRPLDAYATVSKLWKRLGLAVIDGERQRRKTDKDQAAAHGYSPKRRAEVYVVGSVSLFLGQKSGMKYRDIYDARRVYTASRVDATADLPAGNSAKWTAGRCDNDARRVMTKALIADLWGEWRKEMAAASGS